MILNFFFFLDKLDFSDSEQSEDSDAEEIHPQTQTETGKSTYTYIHQISKVSIRSVPYDAPIHYRVVQGCYWRIIHIDQALLLFVIVFYFLFTDIDPGLGGPSQGLTRIKCF